MYVTVPEASRRTGIPRATILSWITRGLITPTIRSLGKGDSTQFTEEQLPALIVIASLTRDLGDGKLVPGLIKDAVAKVRPGERSVSLKVEVLFG